MRAQNATRSERVPMKVVRDLIASLTEDAPVREVRVGPFWTAVWGRACGLASTVMPEHHEHGSNFVEDPGRLAGRSSLELAGLAFSDSTLEAGIGLAAINSLLDIDRAQCTDLNAGRVLVERGRGRKVALVGHFPFVPDLRDVADELWVIELEPQPGDLTVEDGEALIAQAEIIAITGSAFINHTVDRLLGLCPADSTVMMLGPTTPLSPVLFDHGVDIVSGTRVADPEITLRCVAEGATFRQVQGIRLVTMERGKPP
jgi:uncharacterized protein (DUF4213/DUF364 family)